MAAIAEAVRHMLAAGVSHDRVVEAVADMEAAAKTTDKHLSAGAERTRRWRERKASQNVTVTSQASRDVTSVTPQNVPPHPPINSPISEPNGSALAPDGAIDDPAIAERELFDRGKRVLGPTAGGMVAKLKSHFGGNVALTRAAIETASTKHDPRQYVGALLRGRAPPGGSNVVTLDAATGQPINDHQPYEIRDDTSGRPFGAGSRGREAAAFLAGFCRGPER